MRGMLISIISVQQNSENDTTVLLEDSDLHKKVFIDEQNIIVFNLHSLEHLTT